MNTVISVKIDKEVKESAQAVAKDAGLSLSAVINAYLRQMVATRHIEIFIPEPMTPTLEKKLAKAERERAKVHPSFATAEAFLADLKK